MGPLAVRRGPVDSDNQTGRIILQPLAADFCRGCSKGFSLAVRRQSSPGPPEKSIRRVPQVAGTSVVFCGVEHRHTTEDLENQTVTEILLIVLELRTGEKYKRQQVYFQSLLCIVRNRIVRNPRGHWKFPARSWRMCRKQKKKNQGSSEPTSSHDVRHQAVKNPPSRI